MHKKQFGFRLINLVAAFSLILNSFSPLFYTNIAYAIDEVPLTDATPSAQLQPVEPSPTPTISVSPTPTPPEAKMSAKEQKFEEIEMSTTSTTSNWPGCGFQCTAGDTYVTSLQLVDSENRPLTSCSPGQPINAFLYGTFFNNAGSDREAVILLGDLYQGNELITSLNTSVGTDIIPGSCVADHLPSKAYTSGRIYNFNWICGQPVYINNLILSWDTGNATCSDFFDRPQCSSRTTKCYASQSFVVTTPLVADFSVNNVCLGNPVSVENKTSGGVTPYSYNWSFGDGSSSSLQSPAYTYSSAGSYNIGLNVTDSSSPTQNGGSSKSVNVWANPKVDFSASTSICPGMGVNFSNLSVAGSPNGGAISSYLWDFGDGTISVETNPIHQYPAPGDYEVTLTSNDGNSCVASVKKTVTINPCNGTLTVNKLVYPNTDPGKFNLQIDGVTAGTGVNVGNGGTTGVVTVDPGVHSVTESAGLNTELMDYKAVFGGDCDPDGKVSVGVGENKVCTITNTKYGSITIDKKTSGGNGEFSFGASNNLTPSLVNITTTNGTGSYIYTHLMPGTYSLTENSNDDWKLSSLSCMSNNQNVGLVSGSTATLNLLAGQDITCTFNNTKPAKLTVIKQVVNNNGGTKTIDNFPLYVNGNRVVSGEDYEYAVGFYKVTEGDHTGYSQTYQGDCNENGEISLELGDEKTCVVINDDIQPKLTVTKIVDGGDAVVSDFKLYVGDTLIQSGQQSGFNVGTYKMREDNTTGYTGTISGDCDLNGYITLNLGDIKNCVITNTRDTGTIEIIKDVMPDDQSQWDINIVGAATASATVGDNDNTGKITLPTGSYTINESAHEGTNSASYESSFRCTNGLSEIINGIGTEINISLTKGQNIVCTFTNSIKKGSITVTKLTNPAGLDKEFTINLNQYPTHAELFSNLIQHDQSITYSELLPGQYYIWENSDPGWKEERFSCRGGYVDGKGLITLAAGENMFCTIVNMKLPTLTINKALYPNNDQGRFNLLRDGYTNNPGFNVGHNGSTGPVPVEPGIHTVGEAGNNTDLSLYNSVISGDCDASGSVDLLPGEDKVCTITNTRKTGTITFQKIVEGGDARPSEWSFSIDGLAGSYSHGQNITLNTGTYTIRESGPSNYTATGVSGVCSSLSGSAAVLTVTEEGGTCAFTNTGNPGQINGFKFEDNDGDGDYDLDEPKLSGWEIFIDSNSNDALDAEERSVDTNNLGEYSLDGLISGQVYRVCEVITTGWYQSYPGNQNQPSCHQVVVPAGGTVRDINFGNFNYGQISGKKYLDSNGNGEDDPEEPGLSGWIIYIDSNDNGILDDGEPRVKTDENGSYRFSDLPAGNYRIREVQKMGWVQTDPTGSDSSIGGLSDGSYLVTMNSNGNKTQRNFGNRGDLSVIACKYEDLNGPNEGGQLAAVNNWSFRLNGATSLSSGSESNCVTFSNLVPGEYTLEEVHQEGWIALGTTLRKLTITDKDEKIDFVNYRPGSISVTKITNPTVTTQLFQFTLKGAGLENEASVSGGATYKFNNLTPGSYALTEVIPAGWVLNGADCNESYFNNGGEISIQSGQEISCIFNNTQLGQVTVTKFNDTNKNGIKDEAEEALSGWNIVLSHGEASTTKATYQGRVVFDNLSPGSYRLTEELQEGWFQTAIYCDYGGSNYLENQLDIRIDSGSVRNCYVGNQAIPPSLNITKNNNKTGIDVPAGGSVQYTITIESSGSAVKNVKVVDLPPAGFRYRLGSWTALSNKRGDLKLLGITHEPTYSSPGQWLLGEMVNGERVMLSYMADVDPYQDQGLYKDLAWAQGTSLWSDQVVANSNSGIFVGTQVNVVKSTQDSVAFKVTQDEEVEQKILGVTTRLPDTGLSGAWIIGLLVSSLAGVGLIVSGWTIKKRRKHATK